MAVTAGEVIMEFGMKRVLASVQAAATLNKLYDGSPVSLTAISKESKLSTSYLEQILKDWLLLQCQHLQDSLPQHFQLTERLSLLNLQIEQHQ